MTTAAGKLPLLYSYSRSSCSYRVRIALNLKEIQYDIQTIDIIKERQHLSDDFSKVNPMQKIPALHIDGHRLVESLNIMHYLEETRPQNPLLPKDVFKRCQVREICEMIQSGIQPLQNVGCLSYLEAFIGGGTDNMKKEWAQHWIKKGFIAIEKQLIASAGKYSVGNDITLADCCLIPQVYNAQKFKVDLQQFRNISRISKELENHPAFHAAHPSNQPDFHGKLQ